MDFKIPSLIAPLLLGVTIASAAEPSVPHRFDSLRLGSHNFAKRSLAMAPASAANASGTPNFTFFDMPSSTNTETGALNLGVGGVASHVVGCYVPNGSTTNAFNGFEYTLTTHGKTSTATMKTILPAKSTAACAYSINDSGVITGLYAPTGLPAGVQYGFVLNGTMITQLVGTMPNNCVTLAMSINDSSTVVGQFQTNTDCTSDHGWAEYGFVWSNGVFTPITGPAGDIDATPWAINNLGTMVGIGLNPTETAYDAWILQNGVYTSLSYPGSSITVPTSINDAGDIVGYYCTDTFDNCNNNNGPYVGFLYSGGTFTKVTVPGMPWVYPSGINNQGVISGSYEDTNGYWRGFMVRP